MVEDRPKFSRITKTHVSAKCDDFDAQSLVCNAREQSAGGTALPIAYNEDLDYSSAQ